MRVVPLKLIDERHYSRLGLKKGASMNEVKRAYYRLMKIFHSDKQNSNSEKLKQENKNKHLYIQQSYFLICQPESVSPNIYESNYWEKNPWSGGEWIDYNHGNVSDIPVLAVNNKNNKKSLAGPLIAGMIIVVGCGLGIYLVIRFFLFSIKSISKSSNSKSIGRK